MLNDFLNSLALVRIPAVACTAARFGVISPIFLESRVQLQNTHVLVMGFLKIYKLLTIDTVISL